MWEFLKQFVNCHYLAHMTSNVGVQETRRWCLIESLQRLERLLWPENLRSRLVTPIITDICLTELGRIGLHVYCLGTRDSCSRDCLIWGNVYFVCHRWRVEKDGKESRNSDRGGVGRSIVLFRMRESRFNTWHRSRPDTGLTGIADSCDIRFALKVCRRSRNRRQGD